MDRAQLAQRYLDLSAYMGLSPEDPKFEEGLHRCDEFLAEASLAATRHCYLRLQSHLLEQKTFEEFMEDPDFPPQPQELRDEPVFLDLLEEHRSSRGGLYYQDICAYLGCSIHVFNLRAAYLWWSRRLDFATFKAAITSDPAFLKRVALVVADDEHWYEFDAVPATRPPKLEWLTE